MLKSERDPTATDHHEAKLQADALRASVTRLGDSIVHGRALILEEQPREPGSPEREDQIIVYMQRLQDTREKLTRLVDGTLESRDALEHAMGELDAALAGVKYRVRHPLLFLSMQTDSNADPRDDATRLPDLLR